MTLDILAVTNPNRIPPLFTRLSRKRGMGKMAMSPQLKYGGMGDVCPGSILCPWLRPQFSEVRSPGYGERGSVMRSVVNGVGPRGYDRGENRDEALQAVPVFAAAHENSRLGCSDPCGIGVRSAARLIAGCSIRAQRASDHPLRCYPCFLSRRASNRLAALVFGGPGKFRQAHTRPNRRPAISSASCRKW